MYTFRANFSDLEIEIFFAKYDKYGDDGEFTAEETEDILNDLEEEVGLNDIQKLNNLNPKFAVI